MHAVLKQLETSKDDIVGYLSQDVQEIFCTMVGMEVEVAETQSQETGRCHSTAMVGMAGSYNGMISLNVPRELAPIMASSMLGVECGEDDSDVRDALGEIANMIGGSFKHHFVKDGHEVRLSTPSIISGCDYQVSMGDNPEPIFVAFSAAGQQFTVSVHLEAGE